MLYTSYMLLDFCNAVYNEAWTLTKSSKNDAGVFCNSPSYSNETRQRQSKSVFVDNFVKMISDAKSFVWNFFGNLVDKTDGTVKDFNSVYCNNCLLSSEIKAYKDIAGTKNLSQHFECLVKMWATFSTLFVRVNTGWLKTREWKTRDGRNKQKRRAIEAFEARSPQTVWRLWLIIYRTELKVSPCVILNAKMGNSPCDAMHSDWMAVL